MANQASVNGGTRVKINSPLVEGVIGNLAEFAEDVATLAELQAKLASHDLKATISKATIPVGLMVAAAVLAVGAIPVLLIGVAELLAPLVGLSHGGSLLVVAILSLIAAAVVAFLALPRLRHSFNSFQRSREELTRNIAWIKTVLVHSGRR